MVQSSASCDVWACRVGVSKAARRGNGGGCLRLRDQGLGPLRPRVGFQSTTSQSFAPFVSSCMCMTLACQSFCDVAVNGQLMNRMARTSSRSPDRHAPPPPPSPLLPGLGRLDTGYCVLKNRLRHIGLATLVSIAQDTDEEDVLRLVAAAPTVYELYWRQDADSTQQRGRYGRCARNCELAWCRGCFLRGERGEGGYHAAL